MIDIWVENIKTREAWRLDHDSTKAVYLDENDAQVYKCSLGDIRFYPVCPKAAPQFEVVEHGEQLSIWDYTGSV